MAPPPPPSPRIRAVEELVRSSLQPYGADSADVSVTWGAEAEAWFVVVQPHRHGATPVSIGLSVHGSLLVTVANTSMDDSISSDQSDLGWLRSLVDNVFAGRVQEVGRRADSYVRIGAGRSDATTFGAAHLPIPWALRRVRRFTAYS